MDEGVIRVFAPDDLERLQQITMEAFEPVSIDRNIERKYGVINGVDWKTRKAEHIRLDAEKEAEGIFVLEWEGTIVGYITCCCNRLAGIGNIPNLAVDREYRGRGLGRRLIEHAIEYFRKQGMTHARIETLDQNEVGKSLYPSLGFEEVARQVHYCMELPSEDSGAAPSM
jgi:GNAT superfamily N-acetyltransferase